MWSQRAAPPALRLLAWCRLVKVWGVLRWDDLQRVNPKDVELREFGLLGALRRTKTSGAGKKVKCLPFLVPRSAGTTGVEWLQVGFELWQKLAPWERDYFFPRPAGGLTYFHQKAATSSDAAWVSAALMADLEVPLRSNGKGPDWDLGGEKLCPNGMGHVWTGHAERCTLPSMLAVMGVAKDTRNILGRWRAEGSDEYVRSYKTIARSLATRIGEELLKPDSFKTLGEDEACEDVRRALLAKEVPKEEAEVFTKHLEEQALAFCEKLAGNQPTQKAARDLDLELPEVEDDHESDAGGLERVLVSTRRRNQGRTLHLEGGCYHARELLFTCYEVFDNKMAAEGLYTNVCGKCWPKGAAADEASSSSGSSE